MKRMTLLILLVFPLMGLAQESKLNQFFNKYSGKEGYTSVYITEHMFDLFKNKSQNNNDTKNADMDKSWGLKSIKILTRDTSINTGFLRELKEITPSKVYKELMVIREDGEKITFLIRKNKKDRVSELVMLMEGSRDPGLIYLEGYMTLEQISKMSKNMEVKGFDHLDKVDEKNQQK